MSLTIAELGFLIDALRNSPAARDDPVTAAVVTGKLKHERDETAREAREAEEARAIDAGEVDPYLSEEEYVRRKLREERGHGGWGSYHEDW